MPNTGWLPEDIEKDRGYIVTDINRKTNIDGIYAAGDVCIKNLRQVVTAVSDGAVAATSLEKYVEELHKELEIPELQQNKSVSSSATNQSVEGSSTIEDDGTTFISEDIKQQLQPIFERFESKVIVRACVGSGSLADEINGFVEEDVYCGAPDDSVLDSEYIYVGFWTQAFTCCVPIAKFLTKLENKKIFLFGTAGYDDTPEYFQSILDAAKENISASNEIVGEYMCQGKVSAAKQEAIKKMDMAKFETMKKNIQKSQSHPNNEDVDALLRKL